MIEPDDPKLVFLPEDQVLAANGICQVLRDRWFSVHPEKGLLFWQPRKGKGLRGASPQCNSTEWTSQHLNSAMYPWAKVKLIPLVLLPIDLEDYR